MTWRVDAVVIEACNEMLLGEVSIPRALYQMVGKTPVIWVTAGGAVSGVGIQPLSTRNGATKTLGQWWKLEVTKMN